MSKDLVDCNTTKIGFFQRILRSGLCTIELQLKGNYGKKFGFARL